MRFKMTRKRSRQAAGALGLLAVAAAIPSCMTLLPGDPFKGTLPLASVEPAPLEAQLRADVEQLAGVIGERNHANPAGLRAAENFIAAELSKSGYRVEWQTYHVRVPAAGGQPAHDATATNLIAEVRGVTSPDQIVVIGAHYDSVHNRNVHSPGANDNASGVAAVLALSRMLSGSAPACTLRLVFFADEEPPYFWTDQMGSLIYARAAKARNDDIVAMLSIETIGSFSDAPGSQHYPPLIGMSYPDTANFVAFVGMADAEPLVSRCVTTFRSAGVIAAEGAALPTLVPRVGSSDHWSFWKQGYPALMVTDTAPYRYPHYHKPTDTPDKLNYAAMAKVVQGLAAVVRDLSSGSNVEPPRKASASLSPS